MVLSKFRWLEPINAALQVAVLVTIPVEPKSINNVLIILWCLTSLLAFNRTRYNENRIRFVAPFILYFVILMIGLLLGPDPFSRNARLFVEARISFLILPFFLLISQPVNIDRAMKWFAGISTVLCLVCLGGAIIKNFNYNQLHDLDPLYVNPWFFTYFLYADHVQLHPTYFGMFLMSSIVFLLGWRREAPLSGYHWILIAFLGLNLVALMSRLIIGLMAVYFCFFLLFGFRARLRSKLAIALGGAVLLVAVALNPVAQKRIRDTFENDSATFSGTNLKVRMWTALYEEVISVHPLAGIGPVNVDHIVRHAYSRHGLVEPAEQNYNSHNQYIEAWVHHGLFGLFSLLLLYGYYFYVGVSRRNHLMIVAMLVIIVASITESLLMRQKGILFLSFFIPFVYLNSTKHDPLSHDLAEE